jgi:hypothetical protein
VRPFASRNNMQIRFSTFQNSNPSLFQKNAVTAARGSPVPKLVWPKDYIPPLLMRHLPLLGCVRCAPLVLVCLNVSGGMAN